MLSRAALIRERKEIERARYKSLQIEKLIQKEKLEEVQELKRDLDNLMSLIRQDPRLAYRNYHVVKQLHQDAQALIDVASEHPDWPTVTSPPCSPTQPPPLPSPPHSPLPAAPPQRVSFADQSEGLGDILIWCRQLDNPQLTAQSPGTQLEAVTQAGATEGDRRRRGGRGRRRTHRQRPTCAVM